MKLWSKDLNSMEKRTRQCVLGEIAVALVGLFLLVSPELAMTVCVYLIALALCLIGVARVVSYLRNDVKRGIMGMSLAVGLAAFTGGVVLFVFPMIPAFTMFVIFGAILIAGGFAKIQMAIDVKRVGDPRWWIMLILSCASLIMGILALFNPFGVAATLIRVIGAFMIIESIIDIYCAADFSKKVNDLFKQV